MKAWKAASIGLVVGGIVGALAMEIGRPEPGIHSTPLEAKRSQGLNGEAPKEAGAPTNERSQEPDERFPTLEEALSLDDSLERYRALEMMGIRLSSQDLDQAFAALRKVEMRADRQAFIRGIFHFLASGDPKRALRESGRLPQVDDRLAAFKELLGVWSPKQAGDSMRQSEALFTNGLGGFGVQFLEDHPQERELALAWAEQVQLNEGKERLLAAVAETMVKDSPEQALHIGDGLEKEEYAKFLREVMNEWGRTDPKAALAWSVHLADDALRANVQQEMARRWALRAMETVQSEFRASAPGEVRQALLAALAAQFAKDDTQEAFAWLNTLTDSSEKIQATQIVERVAPVGVGASLAMDEGFPVVQGLVDGSPAQLSGQINEGDRILAVDTGNGQFISTNGKELFEVTQMIRGRTGTVVRLQVAAMNADGFDAPRTVQLSRAQILFSRK